jgi:hypothetical protein
MLKPGWNAVYLEVEPQVTAPSDIFARLTDLQSIWMWNSRASAVESIPNPDNLKAENTQWMAYFLVYPILLEILPFTKKSDV